ncbi:hypothetical protein N8630_02535 [Synechococcus sp. AH-601-C19]|nr:hypothetical protein [Synechococcus sp. AH-601-C19]
MELKPEDRNLRDSLKREIQSLEPMALSVDAEPEIKQQYRDAKAAMKVLIGKLKSEGVNIKNG